MNPVFNYVTEKVMALLKGNVIPWSRPWNAAANSPRNHVTGTIYKGINALLLGMAGKPSPYWLTAKQAFALGGNVTKGAGQMVCFWKRVSKDEAKAKAKTGEREARGYAILRYYLVWNLSDITGIPADKLPQLPKVEPFIPDEKAEAIFNGMPDRPAVEFVPGGVHGACYSPIMDKVTLPLREQFKSTASFYSVAFHELGHSTGHDKRLGRKLKGSYDRGSYSFEELVAELTAAFVCSECGLAVEMDNTAAYVQGWLRFLSDEPEAITRAAGQAQKAADYILGNLAKDEPDASEGE